mmetsp:Transcript_17382/g.53195  ORF Transcript_17382/g.53195 Transcript_17382/m.53195 type:complete len:233 (+) Transcript_17382:344-1042(+)
MRAAKRMTPAASIISTPRPARRSMRLRARSSGSSATQAFAMNLFSICSDADTSVLRDSSKWRRYIAATRPCSAVAPFHASAAASTFSSASCAAPPSFALKPSASSMTLAMMASDGGCASSVRTPTYSSASGSAHSTLSWSSMRRQPALAVSRPFDASFFATARATWLFSSCSASYAPDGPSPMRSSTSLRARSFRSPRRIRCRRARMVSSGRLGFPPRVSGWALGLGSGRQG